MKVMPLPGNATYIYVRESGEGPTPEGAQQLAIIHVFEHTANRLGVIFDAQRALTALQNGVSYDYLATQYNIPVRLQDTYINKLSDELYCVTVLCQVVARRSVVPVWDKGVKASASDNITFVTQSVFLPGLGQINKGYKFGGTVTLLGELCFIGGAVGTNVWAHQQLSVMDDCIALQDVDGYLAARSAYSKLRNASYCAWGAAGLLYVWNIIRAATLSPKEERALVFSPSLINSPDRISPAVGLTFKF